MGWLFAHAILVPASVLLIAESGAGVWLGLGAAGWFLGALGWRGGVVRRCLAHSRFYRRWLAVTVTVELAIVAPGAAGNLPAETLNAWLATAVLVAGGTLFAGWFRVIRARL